jgi:hypothetical protein
MAMQGLGETDVETSASLIDVLHRLCALQARGDNAVMCEFFERSTKGRLATLRAVAEAVLEIAGYESDETRLINELAWFRRSNLVALGVEDYG